MGAKRGSRGGKIVKLRKLKQEERLFRDKCDETELKLKILCLEFKLSALSDFNFNQSEMPVLEKTPKVSKRGPMPTLTCEIAKCTFTCKYKKHMVQHQSAVHEIKAEDSMFDKSVEITGENSENIGNITQAENSQEEERKAHSSMDARPHSTLNVIQTCPLEEESEKTDGALKRNRSGSDDEEDEDVKRGKIDESDPGAEADDDVLDSSPPSPTTSNRQRIVAEAKLKTFSGGIKTESRGSRKEESHGRSGGFYHETA